MTWQIEFTPAAAKQLKKIGPENGRLISGFLRDKISHNPRSHGKSLKGALREFWRYRVGNFRIPARIEEQKLLVLVVRVGHRKNVYR
ncbi:MAG TPA: type II toxin-antitoxin system RelE/ParE family toxin [Desulfobulbus sp.]|nr:type II toxin-antitoxin system RelE/ParE family toxin [Desulfobulbus sp.]